MAKLERGMMEDLIFERDIKDEDVVLGPKYGEDAAVLKVGDEFLVAHSDPISGAVENIGWLALNIAANDIAVCGASPRWALPSLQFPDAHPKEEIKKVILDLYEASVDLDIDIIGGHSEMIDGIDHPLVTTTMMGTTEEPIFTAESKPEDKIVQIGEVGIEGTWILACDFENGLRKNGVDEEIIQRAKGLEKKISVVDPALEIRDKVSSMHDPTEGGILQGLYEMAQASNKKYVIDSDPLMMDETRKITKRLGIDPLRLISSGCLLATVPENFELERGKVIGEVKEGGPTVEFKGEEVEEIKEDELFRAARSLR
ncbi:MAG: hydrogenase assembly protein HupF [Candidatus Thermoplasmatota archaeon]|nr:hydrogenase assembly protein HupF [Candidatus Thermoplasmatota archaeon]